MIITIIPLFFVITPNGKTLVNWMRWNVKIISSKEEGCLVALSDHSDEVISLAIPPNANKIISRSKEVINFGTHIHYLFQTRLIPSLTSFRIILKNKYSRKKNSLPQDIYFLTRGQLGH